MSSSGSLRIWASYNVMCERREEKRREGCLRGLHESVIQHSLADDAHVSKGSWWTEQHRLPSAAAADFSTPSKVVAIGWRATACVEGRLVHISHAIVYLVVIGKFFLISSLENIIWSPCAWRYAIWELRFGIPFLTWTTYHEIRWLNKFMHYNKYCI